MSSSDDTPKPIPVGLQTVSLNTRSPLPPAPNSPDEPQEKGRAYSLGEVLQTDGRHPVIFFGRSQAGKTTVLHSLIRESFSCQEFSLGLRENLFNLGAMDPATKEMRKKQAEFAADVLTRDQYDISKGEKFRATRAFEPFFIPVDMTPKRGPSVIPILLMDVAGEAFTPNFDDPKRRFDRPLPNDIADLLLRFEAPISVVFFLPAEAGATEDEARRRHNFAVMSMMRQYMALRPPEFRTGDFLLLLMTKWDQHAGSLSTASAFKPALPSEVADVLAQYYPEAWGQYNSLSLSDAPDFRRSFTHYISDYFHNQQTVIPDERRRRILSLHAKALWNWIHGNATATFENVRNGRITTRRYIFPDAAPPVPGRLSRLIQLFDPSR